MAISSFTASPLMMKMSDCSSNVRAVGISPGIIVSPALSSTSKRSLVIRAERYEGEPKIDHLARQSDPHRMKAFSDTYRLEPSPFKMEEKADAIEIWVKMPGIGVRDIYMYVKDNKLFIQERNDISPFRRMMIQPFESIQLPQDCKKEDIIAKLGNGILYVYVPKAAKSDVPYDIPVTNASW